MGGAAALDVLASLGDWGMHCFAVVVAAWAEPLAFGALGISAYRQ